MCRLKPLARRPSRRVLALCAALLLAGVAPTLADSIANEHTLRAYIDVWENGDTERLHTLVTADFERHAGPSESTRSLAELETLIANTRTIWLNLDITIDDLFAIGNRGALRGGFSGVHRNVNRVVEFPTMSLFRFEGGLIAEEWIVGDNFLALIALGYELVPPGFETIPPPSGESEGAGGSDDDS